MMRFNILKIDNLVSYSKTEKSILILGFILILFSPFFLIKSATAEIGCALIGLSFLYYCFYKKDFSYFKNNFFYFFLLIYFCINLSSFYSSLSHISFLTSLSYFRIIIFIIALSFFFEKLINLKKYFYYSFFLCISILLLDSIYQLSTGSNILGYKLNASRVSSFFNQKLILGSFVVRLLPLFLGIGFLLKFKKQNFYLLIISSILVVLSSERTSFVYLIMTIILYLYLTYNLKTVVYSLAIFFTLFLALFLVLPKNFDRLFLHTYQQLKENKNILGLSYRHKLHYLTAYNIFLDKKLIGQGIKTFRYLCDDPRFTVFDLIMKDNTRISPAEGIVKLKNHFHSDGNQTSLHGVTLEVLSAEDKTIFKEIVKKQRLFEIFVKNGEKIDAGQKLIFSYEYPNGCNTHPHNIYLQFLSELGILGFLLFSTIFIYSLFQLSIILKKSLSQKLNDLNKCSSLVLFCVITSMFPIFPSGNYFNNWMLIISYLPIGFYLFLIKKKDV